MYSTLAYQEPITFYKRECYQDLKNRPAGHYFPMVTKWFQIATQLDEIVF